MSGMPGTRWLAEALVVPATSCKLLFFKTTVTWQNQDVHMGVCACKTALRKWCQSSGFAAPPSRQEIQQKMLSTFISLGKLENRSGTKVERKRWWRRVIFRRETSRKRGGLCLTGGCRRDNNKALKSVWMKIALYKPWQGDSHWDWRVHCKRTPLQWYSHRTAWERVWAPRTNVGVQNV